MKTCVEKICILQGAQVSLVQMNNVADNQILIISSGPNAKVLADKLRPRGTVTITTTSATLPATLPAGCTVFYEYPEFCIDSFLALKDFSVACTSAHLFVVLPCANPQLEQMMTLLPVKECIYADALDMMPATFWECRFQHPVTRDLEGEMLRIKSNLQKLIDNVDNLVWSVDAELKIITCNKSYSQFVFDKVGILPTEGTPVLYNIFDKDFAELRRSQYMRGLEGDHFTCIDRILINGKPHFVETSFAPIVSEQGEVTGVCCHSNDLTEQVLRMKMIEDQNKALREIAFMQSHHVRAPLARIMALSELFEMYPAEIEELQIISNIKYAATELDAVIRAVVDKTASITEIAN